MTQRYKHYLLRLLLAILAFNLADRIALGLLLQDIKIDLVLSDTELGVLSGIAFAAFYAMMGIPLARWADRGDRVFIITITTAVWSAMVALCGLAQNFVQLLLIRIGVAVGEAGCVPPANSLIAHHFSRAERPRAAAIYTLGGPLSTIIGYFSAGWLNARYGWRTTFVLLGLPGLILAALAWLTLAEPRRGRSSAGELFANIPLSQTHNTPISLAQPSLREVCLTLLTNKTFRHLLLGLSVLYFFFYGICQWQPAFFMRSYGVNTSTVGSWLAVVIGGGGLLGTYCGGELAFRYAANNEGLQLRAATVTYCTLAAISVCIYLSRNLFSALGLLTVLSLGLFSTFGPLVATVQTLVPAQMRAVAISLINLFANFIGMGLGPLATGALSDVLRPWAGEESLRYALLIISPGYFWVAWHLWRASKTVTQDIEDIEVARRVHTHVLDPG